MVQRPSKQKLFSLVLTAALSAGAAIAADPMALRFYEDAVTRFNQNDTKGAEIQLRNALSRDPGQLPARILMGEVQLQLGNAAIAEEELMTAEQLGADPNLIAFPLNQARNRLGKHQIVIDELVPNLYPLARQADLWVELGIARLSTNDQEGATIAFEQALRVQPMHQGATLALARIPLSEGDYGRAHDLAEAAIRNQPDDAQAWLTKASALHAQNKAAEAADAYARARDLDPDNSAAGLGEAAALLDVGETARAIAVLEDLRPRFKFMPEVPFLLAQQYREMGRDADADAAMQEVTDLIGPVEPENLVDNLPLLRLAAAIAVESDQLERAYKAISLYAEKSPNDIAALKLMARIVIRMDKPNEAKRALVPVVTAGKADAETLALLGDANAMLGDYIAAESYYRDAIQNYRGGPALMGRLGAMQFRQGLRERALETFRATTDETRGNVPTGVSLYAAMLNFAEGRLDEASRITNATLAREPGNLIALNLRAALFIARGNYDQAEVILVEILRMDQTFKPARYNLAKLFSLTERNDLARAEIARLLAENPTDTRALLASARLSRAVGDIEAAEDTYKTILEFDSAALVPATELVDLYMSTNRPAEAIAIASSMTRSLSGLALSHELLGRVLVARGDMEDAKIALKKAMNQADFDTRRLLSIARLQSLAGAHKDAEISIRRALIDNTGNVPARQQLARSLLLQGNLQSAHDEISSILQVEPKNVEALALLGDILMAENRFVDALKTYNAALDIAITPALMISRFRAMTLSGNGDKALDDLIARLDIFPANASLIRTVAERLHQVGRSAEARVYYENLISLRPEDAVAHNNLANLLNETDSENALKAARRAYELAPMNSAILDTYGWSLIQIGELDKGLALLREAVARDGLSGTLRYHLGIALEEYGSRNEARHQLAEALKLNDQAAWSKDAKRRLDRLD